MNRSGRNHTGPCRDIRVGKAGWQGAGRRHTVEDRTQERGRAGRTAK